MRHRTASPGPATSRAGQASVELVAVLPLLVLVIALLWQAVVAGQAVWLSGSAARAAARAAAVGGDPLAAARAVLPPRLARGVTVRSREDGSVVARLPVPLVVGDGALTSVDATARLPSQER